MSVENSKLLGNQNSRLIGILFISTMVVGVFSVTPSIDSLEYLTEAAQNLPQIMGAALFQFALAIIYFTIAILFFPTLKKFGETAALAFLNLKIMAAILIVISTVLLVSLFVLSQEFVRISPQDAGAFEALGQVLKTSRDHINHVFMVFVMCLSNLVFYMLLIRSKLVPSWIAYLGLLGVLLSAVASLLVLFQVFEIITAEYLLMNAATALSDLFLGLWLIVKGFDVVQLHRTRA